MLTTDSRTTSSDNRFERSGSAIAASRPDLLSNVSQAQQRVLELLLAGLTEPQIAERIGRSRHTVHDHTKAIYAALKVSNRVQLVLLFSSPAPIPAAKVEPNRATRLATVISPSMGDQAASN
jgi:DNA-binding NarL/FixJ family response regulator